MKKSTLALSCGAFALTAILGASLFVEGITGKKAKYLADGEFMAEGFTAPVRIVRDEKKMPYIFASNRDDALMAQGFAMAQDRILQMHLLRSIAAGRLSEFAGEKGVDSDRRARLFGFAAAAARHAGLLRPEDRRFLQKFADGVNLFLRTQRSDYPLEFTLAKIEPTEWRIEDSLAIMYLMGWNSAANYKAELLADDLRKHLGESGFKAVAPIFVNQDNGLRVEVMPPPVRSAHTAQPPAELASAGADPLGRVLGVGSDAWVVGKGKSASGAPILANDPHLENLLLPRPFYASSIVLPDNRLAGVTVAGIPGLFAGRNSRVAVGFTNAYGDSQDVVRYALVPGNPDAFLSEGKPTAFGKDKQTLTVKGGAPAEVVVETTPLGRVFKKTRDEAFVIRWTSFEAMNERLGLDYLFTARSVEDLRASLKQVSFIQLNVLMADKDGNIGWQTTGRYPLRRSGDGAFPVEGDNWAGWVSPDVNPSAVNPAEGWLGNANQMTTPAGYPGTYSTYFSPEYRYERIRHLLAAKTRFSGEDFRVMQQDVHNTLAERLAPVFAAALERDEETKHLARLLAAWNHKEVRDSRAATVFHRLYESVARDLTEETLGGPLAQAMLSDWYFWQSRFEARFAALEEADRASLVIAAAKADPEILRPKAWAVTNLLKLDHPMGRDGGLKGILFRGAQYHLPGSGETLMRARSPFGAIGEITAAQTMRMVVDLGDDEKVVATLNGGTIARMNSKHLYDQSGTLYAGKTSYWWFNDASLAQNATSELVVRPF